MRGHEGEGMVFPSLKIKGRILCLFGKKKTEIKKKTENNNNNYGEKLRRRKKISQDWKHFAVDFLQRNSREIRKKLF